MSNLGSYHFSTQKRRTHRDGMVENRMVPDQWRDQLLCDECWDMKMDGLWTADEVARGWRGLMTLCHSKQLFSN